MYTEMFMVVMKTAMPIFRRRAWVRLVRRSAMRFIIICSRNWTWSAQVVTGVGCVSCVVIEGAEGGGTNGSRRRRRS